MNFLDELNPEQREAVLQVDGPLLILAGAGSGKTRVIAYRVAYLIGAGHAEAREVVAVTFTNKAAEEMRQRVTALLGDAASGAWVSTFHSMCARLLRREAPVLGLSRDFVIYDSSDQLSAVKQAMRDLGIDDTLVQPRAALSRISHAKNLCLGPDSFAGGYNPHDKQVGRIFERYQGALEDSHALDFDDLLLKTVTLFDKPEVRERYAGRFRFLLVDEYQDTNRPQYLLMRRLAEAHRNLCVVGDPDQSIYKWRGADLRNILDFEADYPDATVVRLERNYRSTEVILDAASALIRQNRNRKEKRLWTETRGGEKIRYHQAGDELEEADAIARVAREAVRTDGDTPMAVLYRTNAQSRVIEDALRREGIAYRIVGSVRFYERKEIKDTLAYLQARPRPGRRCEPAAGDQRPDAGDRQGRDGRARRGAAGPRPLGRRRDLAALGLVAPGRRPRPRRLHRPGRLVAARLPRPRGRPRRGRPPGAGVGGHRQGPRPDRLPVGAAGGPNPRRPRGGSRISPSWCRRRGSTRCASRAPRSAGSSTRCRCSPTSTRPRGRPTRA